MLVYSRLGVTPPTLQAGDGYGQPAVPTAHTRHLPLILGVLPFHSCPPTLLPVVPTASQALI
jgi:hypothetical protein